MLNLLQNQNFGERNCSNFLLLSGWQEVFLILNGCEGGWQPGFTLLIDFSLEAREESDELE